MSTLRVLSDGMVDKIAAFDISDSLDLHDPRFGNAGSTEVVCPTCGMRGEVCVGHHASLSLGICMFHPLLYKESQNIINSVCFGCRRPVEKVARSKTKKCSHCGVVNHRDYIIYANDMSAAVRPRNMDYKLAESIPRGVLPEGHVVSKVLVPPIHLRTPEDMEWSTDIQKLYEQLAQAVRRKGDVCSVYANITGAHKNEGVVGIMSGKAGVFRKIMMGKRVEMSARAVVVGDPCVRLDEVAVPRMVAESIKVKVTCCDYNAKEFMDMAERKTLWWEGTDDTVAPHNVLSGMTFQRKLTDGDFVLLNRQPSLSRQSLACFRVVVRKDDQLVFGINPQSTPPFNADFDGDEMNTFFMAQSCPQECRAEMSGLCRSELVAPVQDVVTGCYVMSKENVSVSREVWDDCVAILGVKLTDEKRTTHGLLRMCVPDYAGEVLYKRNLCRNDMDTHALQLVVERWLSARGLTVSLESVRARSLLRGQDETSDAYRERCVLKVEREMRGTGLMHMIDSGAKGSVTHAAHMAIAIGQQYVGGKEGTFCTRSYAAGLTPDEFFGHQMAAREGVVSTGVSTANTGYLNRRACKIMADVKLKHDMTVGDDACISSFW